MEREKHKESLARKLMEKDPSVYLVKPEKSSKSCAWSADCFSLIFNNNVKENFVYCQICSNLITYNSVHGTGSLLRHHCYKKVISSMKDENDDRKVLNFQTSTPKMLKRSLHETENNSPFSTILINSSSDPLKFPMKCRDNTKQKKDIEELIARGDPTIDLRMPTNIKSEVWSNGNFKIVYKNGNKLGFVMCFYCQSLITYKSKTGTASLLRHSCIKRLNASVKAENRSPNHTEIVHDYSSLPNNDNEQTDDAELITVNNVDNSSYGNDNETDNEQYLSGYFPDDYKDEASKLFQYFSYKDMQPMNLQQKKGFLNFGQYLINMGAEYGKINIDTILDGRNSLNGSLGDSFTNTLQKMLKPKFEDHKMSLSCDYWTDHNRKMNFFTLYGHYIGNDIFGIKKANLGTVNFTEDFSAIDYKQLVTSILEDYFTNDSDIETFLSKSTIVVFDDMSNCLKSYSTIYCSCLKLNQIVQMLLDESNYRNVIPNEVLESDSWFNIWEYLELVDEPNVDMHTIDELKQILDPFTKALKNLSSDQKPTINEVYIFRKKLEDHFRNKRFSNTKINELALNLIREEFPMTNLHKIAVFLDPRFKSLKFMTQDDKTNVINMVSKMISSDEGDANIMTFGEENDTKSTIIKTANSTSGVSDNTDSTKYLIEYMDIVEERDETHDEVDMYMNLKFNDIYSTNILEFWESRYDLPHLRQLARDILCIPASAIVSEKHFLDEAKLLAKRRLNMEIDNIKQMLYIHENYDMLHNVL